MTLQQCFSTFLSLRTGNISKQSCDPVIFSNDKTVKRNLIKQKGTFSIRKILFDVKFSGVFLIRYVVKVALLKVLKNKVSGARSEGAQGGK